MSVQDSTPEPRERDWSELLHVARQQDPIAPASYQLTSNRRVKSNWVGVSRSAQVAKGNSGLLGAFGSAGSAVVTHYNDDLSRQRPIGTRVKNCLQDCAAVGCENSDIHSSIRLQETKVLVWGDPRP